MEKPEEEQEQSTPADIGQELLQMGLLAGDEAQESLAKQVGMEVVHDLMSYQLPKEVQEKVPYSFVKKHCALPLTVKDDEVLVVVSDPLNLDPIEELRMLLKQSVRAVYASQAAIEALIQVRYDQAAGEASKLLADLHGTGSIEGEEGIIYDLLEMAQEQAPIIKLLNLILLEAIQQGASDVHFEPFENDLKVRYRIDGVLVNRHAPAREYQAQLLTRIKVMAQMDIAEHRLPQDGRIKVLMGGREIDFRVSTVPVQHGERIVLRVLDKGNVVLGLDRLGMPAHVLSQFRNLISHPEGIILVTGPTGSGKTTTLYSTISEVYSDELNIMTIEDPVEYKLPGIAQIGVRPKINLDFAKGLRHILRQDPDIVMIGEIRDRETAEIAVQASLTGHLVLSTLHTNDAPSAVTRLVDMGIEPYLLSSSLLGVMAQRLVRRICENCKETYQPDVAELRELGIKPEAIPATGIHRGAGCDQCYDSGFKGRLGVYEFMPVTEAIRHRMSSTPDAVELRRLALGEGMSTLKQHGAALVLEGKTTPAEVLRVSRGGLDEELV